MISKYRRILLLFIPVLALAVTACNHKPFGDIAVPGMTSVQPKQEGDAYAIQEELKALHIVNPTPYEIHPGDTFQLSVYNQPTLTSNILIAPDGTANLPLVGILKLSDLNMDDAMNLIEQKLSRYLKSPIVTFSPVTVSGYYFTIAGRVNRPGNYTVSIGQTRLLDAIALAGGFQLGAFNNDTVELADLDNAYIKRNDKKLPVDFKKLVYDGDALQNIPLLNERRNDAAVFRIGGDVLHRRRHRIRMDEIDIRPLGDPVKERTRFIENEIIPAHVRDLQPRLREMVHRPLDETEPVGLAEFVSFFKKHLHPEADPEKRFFLSLRPERSDKS